jgi:hypothetical protein
MAADFDVGCCRRRPPCRRILIYLDTSTLGELACGNPAAQGLSDVLLGAIESERAICVGSPWHEDEIALLAWADQQVKALRTYTLDLRMRHEEELIVRELDAAAREFSGQARECPWDEAFEDDPDKPPLQPFQAQYLNERLSFEAARGLRDEAQHDRRTSESLTDAHMELRQRGLSWEEVAAGNLDAQVAYFLGPLADPAFLEKAEARQRELAREWLRSGVNTEAGSATRKYLRFAQVASTALHLRDKYPAIAADPAGFCESDAVRGLPTVRLFSFLLAALSVDGRQTKPSASDLHDLRHLTYGLSRCDIVTADRRSCALVRQRDLVPEEVELVEATNFDEITRAVERSLPS